MQLKIVILTGLIYILPNVANNPPKQIKSCYDMLVELEKRRAIWASMQALTPKFHMDMSPNKVAFNYFEYKRRYVSKCK